MSNEQRIQRITSIRRRNNDLWMSLLKIALEKAPTETKAILANISANDSEITNLLKDISGEN